MFFRNKRRSSQTRQGIEQLEIRLVPTVSVHQAGATLVIKADNAGDTVEVDGTGAGKVDVTHDGDTTSYTGVKNVTVRMGSGDNDLTVKDLDISGRLVVRTGKGDDTVTLDSVKIGGRTSLNLGAGHDELTVKDSVFAKNVTASLRGGDDTLTLDGNHFNGRAVANGGPGEDTIDDLGNNVFAKRHVARSFEIVTKNA